MDSSLNALSPLDGRYANKVIELKDYFSEYALIKYRIRVEIEWLIALVAHPDTDPTPFNDAEQQQLRAIYTKFTPDDAEQVKKIEGKTNHDVKAVEYYIDDQLTKLGMESSILMVHFACTSEDINNLAYALMVRDSLHEVIIPECKKVKDSLLSKAEKYRGIGMVSRTHGQIASPTTTGKELYNVAERFQRQISQLEKQEVLGKMNGAVGNFNAHLTSYPKIDWRTLSRSFVEGLGLTYNHATTQIEPHDYLAETFHNLIRYNTILIDLDRDIWSYISIGVFHQIPVAGETGSSTMPHKVNPIDFENSEGNLGLANALLDHLAMKLPLSRWQRDLTDSTVLRNIGVAFGYALLAYKSTLKGLSKLAINEEKLRLELAESWEVLAEAYQTVMRRYKISEPYEKLKDLTRGKEINKETLMEFLEKLDLPEEAKKELRTLTPLDYLGTAKEW